MLMGTGEEDEQWNARSVSGTLRVRRKPKIVDTLRMDYDTFTNASFFLQGKGGPVCHGPSSVSASRS